MPSGFGINATDCEGRVEGDLCILSCEEGFTGQDEYARCRNEKIWGKRPKCEKKPCPIPDHLMAPEVKHSCAKNGEVVSTGGSCSGGCKRGYAGNGPIDYTCEVPGP